MTTTRPTFGGVRWWFVCSLHVQEQPCHRRVRKLYLPPRGRVFGCRICHNLTYRSQQENHQYDGGVYAALAKLMGSTRRSSGRSWGE